MTLCKPVVAQGPQIRHREYVMEAQLSGQALRAAYHMPWPYTKTALTCKPLLAQFGTHPAWS